MVFCSKAREMRRELRQEMRKAMINRIVGVERRSADSRRSPNDNYRLNNYVVHHHHYHGYYTRPNYY